jgi:hypothetical protein
MQGLLPVDDSGQLQTADEVFPTDVGAAHGAIYVIGGLLGLSRTASSRHCQQKECPHGVVTPPTKKSMQMGHMSSCGFFSSFILVPQYWEDPEFK